jgi:general secretion pathway protein D
VKKILALCLLGSLAVRAQVPLPDAPATQNREAATRAAVQRAQTNTAPATTAPPVPGGLPATAPTPGAPGAGTPAGDEVKIEPSPEALARKADLEQIMPAGAIDFVAAKLDLVLKIYADLVGKTLLRPANLNAPDIVLKTQTPLTKREIIGALEAVMALSGIALVHVDDKFVKVIPQAQAGQAGAPLSEMAASELPPIGSYITHVVKLQYVKPTEIMPALQPFALIPNSILPIDANGILVLRDYTENVKRMLEMIKRIDVTYESEFISEVIPIKYALASDIASALNSLSGGGGGSTSVGGSGAGGRTTGRGAAAGGASRLGAGGYGSPGGMNQPGFGTPQAGLTQPGGAMGTPTGGSAFSDRLQRIIQRASTATGDLQLLGTTKIISDERMNALLVFATRQDMNTITNIIAKLDVVLAQVLIETIIMDVSFDDTFNFGVSAAQRKKDFNSNFSGAGAYNANKFFDFSSADNTNALGQLIGSGLRYFGLVNEEIFVTLEAAASDGRVNVIQKPRIQTSHATPASLFIGSTVPYVTGSYYGGYGGGPGSTYQQLRVGIGLDVTPFINPDGLVVMQIQESIDEISGSTQIENVGAVPNTTSRTLAAEVAVRDRETIILGGFIRNSDISSKSGVPYLKDIPVLGYLFRSTAKSNERKELIVLMRPTVLRTPELAALQVDVEKKRLPGVSSAERELNKYEEKAAAQEDIKNFRNSTPFTPDEIRQYGTPENNKP